MRPTTALMGASAAVLLATGGELLAGGPLKRFDARIAIHYAKNLAQHDYKLEGGSLVTAHLLYVIGQPWIACVVVGGLALLLSVRTRRWGPALAAVVGLGVAGLGTWALKATFPQPGIHPGRTGSFPSGHTCVAVVSAGLVIGLLATTARHRDLIALVGGGVWGAIMAWGRVAMLAHWLSDVIAGWCLGMIALVLALRLVCRETRSP